MYKFEICFVIATLMGQVDPHGYLNVPPQRSSMWRHGFDTPKNYNDMGLNCGGLGKQFSPAIKGRCGVCGDPFDADEKPNEAGGKFAKGIITGTYEQGGRLEAEVVITANHKGYFEFRLCPHNNPSIRVSQSCLDQNILQVEQGSNLVTKYYIGTSRGKYKMTLRLPAGLTCTQCVLQWTYTAGNNWGGDKVNQEHFVNCADIAITPQGEDQITQAPPATPAPTPRPTYAPTTARPTLAQVTSRPTPSQEVVNVNNNCRAIGLWASIPSVNTWCEQNCPLGNCPYSMCKCGAKPPSCAAVGVWSSFPQMNSWCTTNCRHDPPTCPPSYCKCS